MPLEKNQLYHGEDVILKLAALPYRLRCPALLSVHLFFFFISPGYFLSFLFCSLTDCGKSSVWHENFVISIRNVTSSLSSSDQFCPLTICLFCLCLRRLRVCVRAQLHVCICILVVYVFVCRALLPLRLNIQCLLLH